MDDRQTDKAELTTIKKLEWTADNGQQTENCLWMTDGQTDKGEKKGEKKEEFFKENYTTQTNTQNTQEMLQSSPTTTRPRTITRPNIQRILTLNKTNQKGQREREKD